MNHEHSQKNKGFTLLVAIVVTSMLLLVSFVVVDVALKQLIVANSDQQSQYAFYNADSGIECASYWDLKGGAISAFATSTPGTLTCNNQTVTTGSETVPTVPSQASFVGGGGNGNPTSTFSINFATGCAIVTVTKSSNGATTISSRGYNTCDTSASRRFERGVTLSY